MPNSTRPLDDDDDDLELELEPVDPDIVAHQRARVEQKNEEIAARIDVKELFPDREYSDLDVDWSSLKQFHFTTQHLLGLTAIVAIVMSLYLRIQGCSTLFVVGVVAVAAGWFYVMRLERRQEAERERLRAEFLARGPTPVGVGGTTNAPAVKEAAPTDAVVEPPRPRIDLKFAFSLKEALITMTVAAVTLGLIRWQGVDRMAIVLGLVALVGLIVQATGFQAPRIVVLGWWLLLVMYFFLALYEAANLPKKSAGRAAPAGLNAWAMFDTGSQAVRREALA